MSRQIPTYPLNNLSQEIESPLEVLVLDAPVNESKQSLNIPHRTNYYGIGICTNGNAKLTANIDTYDVIPDCLITMSPHIIKQWQYKSENFRTVAILFTEEFMAAGGQNLNRFPFFESVATHIFLLAPSHADDIKNFLDLISQKIKDQRKHRKEVLQSLINATLFEVASLYEENSISLAAFQTRGQLLAAEFKKLINQYFLTQRSVSFYAEKLFITPGHLTETVREVTGRTPGEWIAEAVVLEASVLLQNPALNIAQITDYLHFPDQSVFGKYFKNVTGVSPAAYRLTFK